MKRDGPPACLAQRVVTSGRRGSRAGVVAQHRAHVALRLMYFLGARPEALARLYANEPYAVVIVFAARPAAGPRQDAPCAAARRVGAARLQTG